jgi:hypothetical protein
MMTRSLFSRPDMEDSECPWDLTYMDLRDAIGNGSGLGAFNFSV